ncbi:carbohydrate porin [Paraburkholderia fungorum]|uniref:carbohydrate porin n=1 Tax=Paraburkholderia fungorum TaxID=134537 RepID=UPI0038B913DA
MVVDASAGLRTTLASYGIGYLAASINSFADNILPNSQGASRATQAYSGQRPTYTTTNWLFITYDLGRFGIPDGQILVQGVAQQSTWNPGGPAKYGVGALTYYQTMFDRRVELKLGLLHNSFEFVGTYIGGALASSVFGPSASIPAQGGLDSATTPTPGIILRYNFSPFLYTKATIQRAVNPDGQVAEVDANRSGFAWRTPNTGVLYLDEIGYRRAASRSEPMTWLRGGAAYNSSAYNNNQEPGTRASGNQFYYFLADRQIWQASAGSTAASRGIYAGMSVMYAPPRLNRFTQYYEFRIYGIGLIESRPSDVVSVVVTDNVFSKDLVEQAVDAGKMAHRDSKAVTLSYNAHLSRGVYVGIGVSYVNNPTSVTYVATTGHALNVLATLNLFF